MTSNPYLQNPHKYGGKSRRNRKWNA